MRSGLEMDLERPAGGYRRDLMRIETRSCVRALWRRAVATLAPQEKVGPARCLAARSHAWASDCMAGPVCRVRPVRSDCMPEPQPVVPVWLRSLRGQLLLLLPSPVADRQRDFSGQRHCSPCCPGPEVEGLFVRSFDARTCLCRGN